MKAKAKTKSEIMVEIAELRAKLDEMEKSSDRRKDDQGKRDLDASYDMSRFPEENPYPVMRVSVSGEFLYANRPAIEMLEAMGWQKGGALPEVLARSIRGVPEKNTDQGFELPCARNRLFSFAISASAREGYINLYGLDITARKQAEEAIRQGRQDLDRAQEVGQIGSWRINVRRNVLTWSDENHHIFGVPKGTPMTYETFLGIVHPDDRQFVDAKWQAGLRGEPYDIEHRIIVDPQVKWVREKAYLEFDDEGKLLGGFGITQDITERKKAEEALKRAKEELDVRVQERTEELAKSQQRLQQLASQLLLAQEKERKRVAVELHDGLMSELAATKFLLEGKIMLLDKGKQIDPTDLRRVSDILAGAIKETRRLMNNLHPSTLDELGLIATLGWLCGEYQRSYPHITVQQEIAVSEKDIAEGIKVVIYRVLQEALNNFARHGKGDRVEVSLSKSDGTFSFVIRDNGQGFDVENAKKGLGLESMRERVELSGGEFLIESTTGQGTTIRANWSR